MPIAIWSSRFETGSPILDTRHRALFDAVNRLAESCEAGNPATQA